MALEVERLNVNCVGVIGNGINREGDLVNGYRMISIFIHIGSICSDLQSFT